MTNNPMTHSPRTKKKTRKPNESISVVDKYGRLVVHDGYVYPLKELKKIKRWLDKYIAYWEEQ